jgi:hypothetical protein
MIITAFLSRLPFYCLSQSISVVAFPVLFFKAQLAQMPKSGRIDLILLTSLPGGFATVDKIRFLSNALMCALKPRPVKTNAPSQKPCKALSPCPVLIFSCLPLRVS